MQVVCSVYFQIGEHTKYVSGGPGTGRQATLVLWAQNYGVEHQNDLS